MSMPHNSRRSRLDASHARSVGYRIRKAGRTLPLVLVCALLLGQLPNHALFLARAGAPLLPATGDSPDASSSASAPAGLAGLADGPATPLPLVLTPAVPAPTPAGQAALPDGPTMPAPPPRRSR